MDVRVGDVVRLKPMKVKYVFSEGDFSIDDRFVYDDAVFRPASVEEIILREETDAEKIARLEARVKELEAQQKPKTNLPDFIDYDGSGQCPTNPLNTVEVKFRDGRTNASLSAQKWRWEHFDDEDDIVAYRVLDARHQSYIDGLSA